MPYVQRNAENAIILMSRDASSSAAEFLPSDNEEVLRFLVQTDQGHSGASLLKADLEMIRVIEDVIDLLVARNLILFSDLPPAVQTKLLAKKGRREQLFGRCGYLLAEDEPLL